MRQHRAGFYFGIVIFYFSMTVAGWRITGVRRTIRVLGVRRDRWHGQRRDAEPFVQLSRYDNFVSVRSS